MLLLFYHIFYTGTPLHALSRIFFSKLSTCNLNWVHFSLFFFFIIRIQSQQFLIYIVFANLDLTPSKLEPKLSATQLSCAVICVSSQYFDNNFWSTNPIKFINHVVFNCILIKKMILNLCNNEAQEWGLLKLLVAHYSIYEV